MPDRTTPQTVGVVLFDDVEILDFAGPYEVLCRASNATGSPLLTVRTVAADRQVTCYGGLRVIVDSTLDDCPWLDAIIVPGGPGADNPTEEQQAIIPFVQRRAADSQIVASVCTGAFILGRAALLDGRRATTHPGLLDAFRAEFPRVDAVVAKVVDEGTIITAGGVSSGIDLALYLIQKWFGDEVRRRSARNLDGPWQ